MTLLLIKIYVDHQPDKPIFRRPRRVTGIDYRRNQADRSQSGGDSEEQRQIADAGEFELEDLENEDDAAARRLVPLTPDPVGGVDTARRS